MAIVEYMWIELQTDTDATVVGACYRNSITLVDDYEQFSNSEKFYKLNSDKSSFYALGNYNFDLIKIITNNSVRMRVII